MHRTIKRSLAAIMVVLIMFTSVPFNGLIGMDWLDFRVHAVSEKVFGDYKYVVLSDGTAEITKYNGTSLDVVIPSELEGIAVTSISGAFNANKNILKVVIPYGVRTIGANTFRDCVKLEKIDIPNSVEVIDFGAFYNCESLKSIIIPDSVNYLGESAFCACEKLSNVEIGSSITEIRNRTFYRCNSLINIDIPNNITNIDQYAFAECSGLKEINWSEGLKTIGDHAFALCKNLGSTVVLPDSVEIIGQYAFYNCDGIVEFYFGNMMKSIEAHAFSMCGKLATVVFNESLESIGDFAFYSCGVLTNVDLPDELEIIGGSAFKNTAITKIRIPNNVTSINSYTFSGCDSLTEVVLGNKVRIIGTRAFEDCINLNEIYIKKLINNIEAYSFSGCKNLKTVYYAGTEAQAKKVVVGSGNDYLQNAKFYFNYADDNVEVGKNVVEYQDHIYMLFDKSMDWYAAKEYCESIGGHLATITSQREQDALETILYYGTRNSYWLGREKISGVWNWITGENSTYNHWLTGQPDNNTGLEDKLMVYRVDNPLSYGNAFGKWNDLKYDGTCRTETFFGLKNFGFICEWDDASDYYNYYKTIKSDSSVSERVDVSEDDDNEKNQYIVINPKEKDPSLVEKFEDFVAQMFKKLTNVEMKGADNQTLISDQFLINRNEIDEEDISFDKKNYRTYIIPSEVLDSWNTYDGTKYEFDMYMEKDKKDGKPYVSTVFGREYGENEYKDLSVEEMLVGEDATYDIIISAVGLEGQISTYYISQDNDHRIFNDTGVFKNTDLYKELDFGKETFVYVIDENNIVSTPVEIQLTKNNKLNEATEKIMGLYESEGGFRLLDTEKFAIGDNIPIVGGTEVSLDSFYIPNVGVYIKDRNVKISLGIDLFEAESENQKSAEIKWINFKKGIKGLGESFNDELKDGADVLEEYQKFASTFSNDKSFNKAKLRENNSFNVSALGYIEGRFESSGFVVKEGLLKVGGELTYRFTQQAAVYGVPVYGYVEAGAEVGVSSKVERYLPDENIPFDFRLLIEVAPALVLGAGFGVKDAISAGLYGKCTLPYTNDSLNRYHSLYLEGELGIEAEFFVIKPKLTILPTEDGKDKITIFETYYPKLLRSFEEDYANNMSVAQAENTLSIASRDYLEESSGWLGENPVSTYSLADKGISYNVLDYSIYGQTQSKIVSFGDNVMMVWVQDPGLVRDAYNRMRLVYSLYDKENNSWSEPKAIYDDGNNDAYPSLATDGENVYVAWQKIDKNISKNEAESVNVFLENSEIFVAKYDAASDCFADATKLTDNEIYDYIPSVVVKDGNAVVYYATNNDNNLSGANNNSIYRHEIGKEAELIAAEQNYIIYAIAEIVNGSEKLSYSADSDGDMSTSDDIAVNIISDGVYTTFEKGENVSAHMFADYSVLDKKETLFVSDMSNIYYEQDGETKSVFSGSRLIDGNINFVEQETGLSIIWTENNEVNGNDFWSTSYEDGVWTEPVKISNFGSNRVSQVDVAMLEGKLVGVCNFTEINYDKEKDKYTTIASSLCSFTANDFTDISIDIYGVNESEIIPGKTSSIDVYVNNAGTIDVNKIKFLVSDTLGTETTITKDINLKSGTTELLTINYPVPENYTSTILTVTATIVDETGKAIEETDIADNTESFEIGNGDLVIIERKLINIGENYMLKAVVENNSAVDAEGIAVSAIFNDDSAEPFEQSVIASLGRNQYVDYELAFNKDLVKFDENGVGKLYIKVTSSSKESADGDNQICVLVSLPNETNCGHPLTEIVEAKAATCTEIGHKSFEVCMACYVAVNYVEIPATGHKFTEQIIDSAHLVSAASYTSPAVYKYDCANCKTISADKTFTYGSKLSLGKTSKITPTQTTKTVKLTWKAVSGANIYRVYQKNGSSWKKLADVTSLNYTVKNLKAGTKYSFAVKAGKKVDGKITWASGYTTIATATKAVAPSKVTATQNTSAIKLTWNKVTGATGYRIYYKLGNSWKVTVSSTTATSHTFKNLKAGAKFTFAVKPYIKTDSGVVWSAYTEFTTATKPATVTAKATSPSKGKINLTWNQVNGADGYQIYYKIGNGGFKLYKIVGASTKSMSFSNLKSGTKYTFAVRAGIKTSGGNIFGGYKTATVAVK